MDSSTDVIANSKFHRPRETTASKREMSQGTAIPEIRSSTTAGFTATAQKEDPNPMSNLRNDQLASTVL
ncbi:unnamed protein product [Eruca vesicaria subsp. sativa]|uniref:Uncharacterized protein n=1 Tax=Eruca vesicaria subsp. sativa TaxID=29727 RepID=A0ABC8M9V2_ERUVS|nr:unnamed protein product [Eruca vesicaria subsp. sativa]